MTIKIDANGYDAITFDCYGTLIDWEAGLMSYIQPLLEAHDAHAVPSFLLDFYGRTESKLQAGPYRPYRQILTGVLTALGDRLGFHPSADALAAFPESIGDWLPFPDTIASLKALGPRFQLVVVSNIDDDLFDLTQARLNVNFDHVDNRGAGRRVQARSAPFKAAIERIGVPKERILHVAQSLFHDIAPAKAMGLDTVWIDRHDGHGSGATPASDAAPKWTLRNLGELVEALS